MKTTTASELVFACHSAACRPPTSGGTGGSSPAKVQISHIRGDIARERKAISVELTAQGVAPDNPLRHIFESPMGNRVLVVRNEKGDVVGGVQYDVSKRDRQLNVRDMRMTEQRSGHGTKAFQEIAKVAVDEGLTLHVWGAVASAKPFYAKQGAVFQQGSSHGEFTKQARDALAQGKPIPGHPEMPYEEWVKIDFSLTAAAANQPRVPAGSSRGGQWASTAAKVRSVLTDDLRKAPYKGNCNPMTGHCYVASEAMYHALGGKDAGWTPHQITHEGSPHWFLRHKSGAIVDPTADQFKTPVPYDKARGKGFLTKKPSKRAQIVLERAGLS